MVFFLEDNPDVLDSTVSFFESQGVHALGALTPPEGWLVLETWHQDIRCAFIDKTLQRDQSAGVEFLLAARARFPEIDFALLTAWKLDSTEHDRINGQKITLIEKAAVRPAQLLGRYHRAAIAPVPDDSNEIAWDDPFEVAAVSGDLLFSDRLKEDATLPVAEGFVDRVGRLAQRRVQRTLKDGALGDDSAFDDSRDSAGVPRSRASRASALRNWLAFWSEDVKQSYRLASDHSNLASFVGSILSGLLGVVGVSAVTPNKLLAALGAGLGLLLWFVVLVIFVTPAKLWVASNSVARRRPIVVPEGTFSGLLADYNGKVSVTNIGNEAATDAVITWPASDEVWFEAVRVMKPDEKATVSVHCKGGLNPVSAFILAAQNSRYGLSLSRTMTASTESPNSVVMMPKFVPACLTYRDAQGVSVHSHDYVFAKDSTESVRNQIRIIIRRRSESERFYGPLDA